MASFSQSTFSKQTIADFIRRNLGLILGVTALVTFWMLVYTFAVYKPSYAAKATVIIRDSAITGRYVEPDQYYAMQTTSSSSSNPVLNTMGILKSGAISDAMYDYFRTRHPDQLSKNHIETKADWQRVYGDGAGFIKAKNQPGTDLIAIQFSWSNPEIAKEALDVVVKSFQETSRDLNKEEQISRTHFLARQVGEIEEQLAVIRRQKSDYQSRMRTVSVKREGDDLAGSRMELSNRLSQVEAQAQGKEQMLRRYQQILGMTPEKALRASALGQNATLSRLQDELYRLEQVYSQLNASLTDSNPKVEEIRAQINQVKANIRAERARTVGRILEDNGGVVADSTRSTLVNQMLAVQGESQDLRAQASVLQNRLGEINGEIRDFPEIAEGLANIEQKEASLSLALDQLRQKVLEGRLKEEQTLSNVFIVDAPRLPDKASFPTRTHLIVLSVVLGLGAGLAAALLKEQVGQDMSYTAPAWLQPIDDDADEEAWDESFAENLPAYVAPAALQPVTASAQALIPTEEVSDRRPTPVSASLFDSLVPVAGPIRFQTAQAKTNPQPAPLRPDLMGPLPKPISQPVAEASQAEKVTADDLLPPPMSAMEQPVPQASLVVSNMESNPEPGIENEPVQPIYVEELLAEVETPIVPKKQRGLPAFLLEESAKNERADDLIAIPRKALLSAEDDLMQDMRPMDSPLNETAAAPPTLDVEPASSPEEAYEAPVYQPRRQTPPLKLGKSPERHPSRYFGMASRNQKQTDLPISLSRMMLALEHDSVN